MRTRKKILLLLFSVTLLLNAAVLLHASEYQNPLTNESSSPGTWTSLWYGGLALFAIVMAVVGLRMARDREQKALRRQLAEMEVAKAKEESLREQVVLEEKRLRHARADAIKELEGSLSRIQTLDALLREKEKLLRNRDWEIKALRSQVSALGGQPAPAKGQLQSVLEEEAEKQAELLRAKDAALAEQEKSLNGKIHALESQLSENEKFLKVQNEEVQALRKKLTEQGAARNQAETLFQEEVKREKQALHEKDAQLKGLEKRLMGEIHALEQHLGDGQNLLRGREIELESLRSERDILAGKVAELDAAKERAENLLKEELKKSTEILQSKVTAVNELEQRLSSTVDAFESRLTEREKLLQDREAELAVVRSKVNALAEMGSAKERAEYSLQEELRRERQALQEKDAQTKDLEQRLIGEIHALERQLGARENLLRGREIKLESLQSERDALSGRLTELESAKERAEILLKEELRKNTAILQSKVTAIKELEERLNSTADALESRLAEKEKSLQDREAELAVVRSKVNALAEMGSAKERAEYSLQEELTRERQALQEKDAQTKDLEQRLIGELHAFEVQLGDREKLLESRTVELQARKAELDTVTGQLAEMAAAKNQAESLLREELRKKTEILEATDAAVKELDRGLSRRVQALERQLGEREKLLQSRDAELESLRSERDTLTERLTELELTKEREASLLKQELQKSAEILQSKVTAVNELEQRLSSTVDAFESRLTEKEKLLQDRNAERETLRLKMEALAETGSARERAEHSLQEELRREGQALEEKDAQIKELQAHLSATVDTLENQLSERDEALRSRNLELEALRAEINALTDRLAHLAGEKSQAESLLLQELEKKTELLQSTDTAFKELHENLGLNVDALKLQLSQRDEFLKERDAELDALRDQLTQIGLAKEYAENLLQEELRKKTEILETTNAAFQELEKGVNAKVHVLQRQLEERDELLQNRDAELEALRAGATALIGPINGSGAVPEPQPEHSAIVEEAEEILERVKALESLLDEKEELLQTQNGHIDKLASELLEKRTQLARHERAVWQSIERRSTWKQRLAKLGISIKD